MLVNFNIFYFYILLYYLMLSKLFLHRCYSCLDAHFYDDETVTVVLKESVQQEGKERVLAQLPLSSVYTDEDQDRKFIWDSMERYWKTLSKSENVELKSKLSKYCDCVQLLILCACVKILKTETLFVPGEQDGGNGSFLNSLVCGFWEVLLFFILILLLYLPVMKCKDQLKTPCRIRNLP